MFVKSITNGDKWTIVAIASAAVEMSPWLWYLMAFAIWFIPDSKQSGEAKRRNATLNCEMYDRSKRRWICLFLNRRVSPLYSRAWNRRSKSKLWPFVCCDVCNTASGLSDETLTSEFLLCIFQTLAMYFSQWKCFKLFLFLSVSCLCCFAICCIIFAGCLWCENYKLSRLLFDLKLLSWVLAVSLKQAQ